MSAILDPMDIESPSQADAGVSYIDYEKAHDSFPDWNDTLGLPEELMVHIMTELKPKERCISSLVSTTWCRLVKETWKFPYGSVKPALGFHALMAGKILRQCIPHVNWSVPHLESLPVNVDVYSPTFEQDYSAPQSAHHSHTTWRLKLRRLPPNTSPEQPDLVLSAELTRAPHAMAAEGSVKVFHYARIENPASYSWAEFHTAQAKVATPQPGKAGGSIQLLSSDLVHLTSADRGFLAPPTFDSVTFKVVLARADVEHVAVFTEEDSLSNRGPDLFSPTTKTIMLHMEPDWLKGSQADAQRRLRNALRIARPHWDLSYKEFWRVIMRRNHSFRPVSKELRSYESPFYAVYAIDVPSADAEKVSLFFKVYDGSGLRYLGKRFGGPIQTLRGILHDFDLNTHSLFEEVHSRRLDKIEMIDNVMGSMEIGSGDVVVICPRGLEEELHAHYKSLVYTSNLVKIAPNMWHT
jgi:hypothetical protein